MAKERKEARRYNIIYADPPWRYRVWNRKDGGRSAESHYHTQAISFLKRMDIECISKPDSVLFMWATFPCLPEALELGESWGFTFKTVAFTWVKTNVKKNSLFIGMGYYTRANAEIVLLFTKGKSLHRIAKNIPQVLIAPRSLHSEKPDEIRRRIVRLYGDLLRLELFARTKYLNAEDKENFYGWDVFGNEAENSIQISMKE